MRLSVVIPVYNECKTVERVLQRVAEVGLDTEIIVVDDGSSDGTREILTARPEGEFGVILHERNGGKCAALRTGFAAATGDFVIVQDADLEYDPADYEKLLNLAREQAAIAVYGSRLLVHQPSMSLRHFVGNSLLTGLRTRGLSDRQLPGFAAINAPNQTIDRFGVNIAGPSHRIRGAESEYHVCYTLFWSRAGWFIRGQKISSIGT